jgi:hypothetical protein
MSDDFLIVFEEHSPCCGDVLTWEWNEDNLYFEGECDCFKRYILRPLTARFENLDGDGDEDSEFND